MYVYVYISLSLYKSINVNHSYMTLYLIPLDLKSLTTYMAMLVLNVFAVKL